MEKIIAQIFNEAENRYPNKKILSLVPILNSGSDRHYFRMNIEGEGNIVATHSLEILENATFINHANILKKRFAVPEILHVSADKHIYFQSDIGQSDLLQYLQENISHNADLVFEKYIAIVDELVQIQMYGHEALDFKHTHTFEFFDSEIILQDLFYFKNFFLDLYQISYNPKLLLTDFFEIANFFSAQKNGSMYRFMYRDFQARNILLDHAQKPVYIDFQGGMMGPVQYDIISFVFQAKANLPEEWKNNLLTLFKNKIKNSFAPTYLFDENLYNTLFNYCFLIRQLQILGAYGFRGEVQNKPHFKASIKPALLNIKKYQQKYISPIPHLNYLKQIIEKIITLDL